MILQDFSIADQKFFVSISFCLHFSFVITVIILLSQCRLMSMYHLFRLIFNKFPHIWANKSWKENECHEWFLGRLYPVFQHGIVLLGQEVMSVIAFFLDFVPRSTIFIAWLVVKGKYMICSLFVLSLCLITTHFDPEKCSHLELRFSFERSLS